MKSSTATVPVITAVFITFFSLSGCASLGQKPIGQAALKNFETRTVDAPYDDVFMAATEALFDLGYIIQHSDKASGILTGEKQKRHKGDFVFSVGGSRTGVASTPTPPTVYNVSLLIRSVNEHSTNVRIKTAVDGEEILVKEAIDKIWLYIERQVLMESPPSDEITIKRETPVITGSMPKAQPVR